jgi:hypothetical protein
LEWEYNGLDHNLRCINCSTRYYNTLPVSQIDKDIDLLLEQTQRRAA